MTNVKCPDCEREMQIGYIPDRGDAGIAVQMVWHSSTPQPSRVLGLKTGSVKPSDGKSPLPIWAFRCPQCGLLRLHAIPDSEKPSE